MNLRLGTWLCAAVLGAAVVLCALPLHAADAPPRVPFSAFRVKPNLAPLAAPDTVHEAAPAPAAAVTAPMRVPVRVPGRKPQPEEAPAHVQEPDDTAEIAVEAEAPAQRAAGMAAPVPERKPRAQGMDSEAVERILASPGESRLMPRPPVAGGDEDVPEGAGAGIAGNFVLPPPKPNTAAAAAPGVAAMQDVPDIESRGDGTVRIRDRNRFGAQDRMAGTGYGGAKRVTAYSFSLRGDRKTEDDTRDMERRAAPSRGDGVSPVLLPGNSVTVAAPDRQDVDKRGLPAEVIVFFQENSTQMEVGQGDIIDNDVVRVLKERPGLALEIVGYSEKVAAGGGAEGMSRERADSVRDYLVRKRIDDSRLTLRAKGDNTGIEPRDRVEMYFSQ